MSEWIIFCDFDGTVCIPDSSLYLMEKFGNPMWEVWENQVLEGKLSEREVFPLQVTTIDVEWPVAKESLRKEVKIRDGFKEFAEWADQKNLPLHILSSGLRNLIDELLDEAQVRKLSVYSNDVLIEKNKWEFIPAKTPRLEEHCSHCKCNYLTEAQKNGKKIIYIGDGYTDFCPSRRAHIVFAIDSLAKSCQTENRPYFPFISFDDISLKLEELLFKTQEHHS